MDTLEELEFKDEFVHKYNSFGLFKNGLCRVRNVLGKYGYIDTNGNEVIPCEYVWANDFSEGRAVVENVDRVYGYIDEIGNKVIPLKYRNAMDFREGKATVYQGDFKNEKAGVIDDKGGVVIPFEYTLVWPFYCGIAKARNDQGLKGFINEKGNIVIPFQFDEAYSFCEGLGCAEKNGKWYLINQYNQKISKPYDFVFLYDNGYAMVGEGNKYYIVDRNFEYIRTAFYSDKSFVSMPFSKASFAYRDYGKIGFIMPHNDILPIFIKANEFASEFSDDVAVGYFSNDLVGFVDKKGNQKSFPTKKYVEIQYFSEGYAAVKNPEGLWGYIDKEGYEVIACQYEQATYFSEGLARVMDNGTVYFIDKNGKKQFAIPKVYYSTLDFEDITYRIMADTEQELYDGKLEALEALKETLIERSKVNIEKAMEEKIKKLK